MASPATCESDSWQASHPNWAKRAGIDTRAFRPQHSLIFAHVWLVHRAFETEGASTRRERRLLQEAVFDELWEDTQARIRASGVAEISVNKHLTDVQKYSFQAALEYDDASSRDGADRRDALGAAIWRHVHLGARDVRRQARVRRALLVLSGGGELEDKVAEVLPDRHVVFSKTRRHADVAKFRHAAGAIS